MKSRVERPPIDERFAEWFSGFVDAEGTFIIRIQENSVSLTFRIKLHKDDVEVLYKIKRILGIGNVKIYGNQAVLAVERFQDIWAVLIPILL